MSLSQESSDVVLKLLGFLSVREVSTMLKNIEHCFFNVVSELSQLLGPDRPVVSSSHNQHRHRQPIVGREAAAEEWTTGGEVRSAHLACILQSALNIKSILHLAEALVVKLLPVMKALRIYLS